jgi:hypothetical protein
VSKVGQDLFTLIGCIQWSLTSGAKAATSKAVFDLISPEEQAVALAIWNAIITQEVTISGVAAKGRAGPYSDWLHHG